MNRHRHVTSVVFLDLIMNALLSFIALFILAYVQISPRTEADPAIQTEGKYVVVMRWADGSPDDVDLYVMDPVGNVAFFSSREVGLMHLERDDLGNRGDTVNMSGGDVNVEQNEERTIIRGIIPGEYTVNVHMFRKQSPEPTAVTISLYRLIGSDTEMVRRERILARNGDESTAFRFTLAEDGSVTGINELPRPMAGSRAAGGGP